LVHQTFKKMYDEGLVYRDFRLVNYCTFDGTSFSDLEVIHEEKERPLYYLKYGPFVLATTRPETKFGDTAVAVHPEDKRYQQYIGHEIEIETVLGPAKLKVIADESVDRYFGTGVVKITPAHDFADFETGKRHKLGMRQVIGFDGKLNKFAGKFAGMYVKEARRAIVEEMQQKGLIEKIDEHYVTRLNLCYKCKNVLEPLPKEQWFMRVRSLADKAIEAVKKGEVKIYPKNFETIYFQWLEGLRDWNLSRQIVWGIRIPAWKNKQTGEWKITDGKAPEGAEWEQDTDTFDTWFSSGQWPILTLKTTPGDFERFYPTSVMETAYDILKAWVTRMVMLGIYLTGEVPFKDVLFHGIVNDPYGKKMSKSKGNVINPLELADQYGADAVRFALIYGNSTGNDQALSYPKLDAARKFANKLWNMARFIEIQIKENGMDVNRKIDLTSGEKGGIKGEEEREMYMKKLSLIKDVDKYLKNYQFNLAAELLYDFIWHDIADKYLEYTKVSKDKEQSLAVLFDVYRDCLKLLHPFMPFITEEIYQKLGGEGFLMIAEWPKA
ncbi:MAG TPA: valine--tRNA ligase, partial [Patescibacteria group bacterium]